MPDVHARHLASRERRTLGIIVSDIENPFFPEVVKGFEIQARHLGYDVILSDTNYDPRRTREAADRMMEHKVRGVAIMTSEINLRLIHQTGAKKDRGHVSRSRSRAEIHEQFADRLFFRREADRGTSLRSMGIDASHLSRAEQD